jgi:acyl-coenzyme A thioesterase PaaI-like protein
MKKAGTNELPPTVTADFHVKLRKPTPSKGPVIVKAIVVESTDNRATVEATIEVDGVITSTCRGTFVAVTPGHPAYHRW